MQNKNHLQNMSTDVEVKKKTTYLDTLIQLLHKYVRKL